MTDKPVEPLSHDTTWMRDDCQCPTVSPDGDSCALSADYTTGLCAHCQGHARVAALSNGLDVEGKTPKTEAGRAMADMLEEVRADYYPYADYPDVDAIIAIEQEAAARVAAPSDGLREARYAEGPTHGVHTHGREVPCTEYVIGECVIGVDPGRPEGDVTVEVPRAALATTGQREGEPKRVEYGPATWASGYRALRPAQHTRTADPGGLREAIRKAYTDDLIAWPEDEHHRWCDGSGGDDHRFDIEMWLDDVVRALTPEATAPEDGS